MSFPHFIRVPAQDENNTKSVFIDNLTYDMFLLTDLTRCAAILKFCEDPDNITETTSSDAIFDSYFKLTKNLETGIMNYFLTNFEQILLMYIHSRFGNLFHVIIERVKEPLVKFPIGCFVDKTNLIVIYSPPTLIEYVDRLSMSLLLYSSNNGFIRNSDSNEIFKSKAIKAFDDKMKSILNVDDLQHTFYSDSYHSKASREIGEFLNGIAPNYEENMEQLTCDNLTHPSITKTIISTFAMSHFDPIAFSSTRVCYDNENDDDDNEINTNDALFLTSNYIAAQNMMLDFNRIFSEKNKSSLLFLSTIRTLLSTAVRPIVDLFVIRADEKEQKINNKRKRQHFDCNTQKNKLQQKFTTVDVDGNRSVTENNINTNLRQKRLNIDVHIKN